MKKIEAIVQPFKLEEVMEALTNIGINGMTISDVSGHGRRRGHTEIYPRGQEYLVDLLPKIRFELAVSNQRSEEVVETITQAARTGQFGAGKIFVYPIADAIRIRNGDRGDAAL
jgi:nitrogen regulatory protein P-II 1